MSEVNVVDGCDAFGEKVEVVEVANASTPRADLSDLWSLNSVREQNSQ